MSEKPSSILQEIKQTRPFRSVSQEAVLGLFRTVDMLKRDAESRFAPGGITGQQYNVLRILRGAGPEGLPTLEIAERMVEQAPGITRLLDRLEAKRLVRRERCPEDRRQVTCRITTKGLELLIELDPIVEEAENRIGSILSDREQRQLVKALDRLRAGLRASG